MYELHQSLLSTFLWVAISGKNPRIITSLREIFRSNLLVRFNLFIQVHIEFHQ
jgi:hypothetical protein